MRHGDPSFISSHMSTSPSSLKRKLVLSVHCMSVYTVHTGETSEGAGVKRLSKLSKYCFLLLSQAVQRSYFHWGNVKQEAALHCV